MKSICIALYAIAICGVLTFVHSFALADGGTAAPADPSALTLSMFYPVLAALCGALAGFIRSKTNSEGFWHQWYGHAVIMIGGAFLGSLSDMLARGAVTKLALIGAAAGAIGAWASALQNTAVDVKAAASKTLQVLILGLAVGQLGGCTPGGEALGKCELGQLPNTLQVMIAQIAAIVAQPGDYLTDLENAGKRLAPGQLGCIEQAIAAALEPTPSSPDSPVKALMRERLKAHAAKLHACRDLPYGEATLSRIRALVSNGNVRATDRAIFYGSRALVRW